MIAALQKEIALRKEYATHEKIKTIYFGGGTPSLLANHEINELLEEISKHFTVDADAEITLEANPDDISTNKLLSWKQAGVNRLSIGVQSFLEEELRWMNRAHSAIQSTESLQLILNEFSNVSVDLIYGSPILTNEQWQKNVATALSLQIPHLSCYALTVEPQTPLHKMIRQQKIKNVNSDKQAEQFLLLMDWLEAAGYEHYEISNFSKPGWRSRHNTSYWQGEKYIGIGPSAHSFDEESRQWNIANNQQYIQSINNGIIPFEKEILTPTQKLNEYIMTSLRTIEGLQLNHIPTDKKAIILNQCKKYIETGLVLYTENNLTLTREGKLLADGIAADLFF